MLRLPWKTQTACRLRQRRHSSPAMPGLQAAGGIALKAACVAFPFDKATDGMTDVDGELSPGGITGTPKVASSRRACHRQRRRLQVPRPPAHKSRRFHRRALCGCCSVTAIARPDPARAQAGSHAPRAGRTVSAWVSVALSPRLGGAGIKICPRPPRSIGAWLKFRYLRRPGHQEAQVQDAQFPGERRGEPAAQPGIASPVGA